MERACTTDDHDIYSNPPMAIRKERKFCTVIVRELMRQYYGAEKWDAQEAIAKTAASEAGN